MNNPYGHYGVPGGFNFGRPCMHPYQYMQYPGFVFPHAPIYPMDYRRMFEPRFHTPTWNEMPRQQHHTPQPHGRREMACSEAQTDPSDAITKLIECLDKIRANELQGAERELDSGVASQTSGMFSPGEEKKSEEQGAAHLLALAPDDSHLESPAVTFSDSTTAVYDGESSQRSLDGLSPHGCWSGVLEEELPLDSSSVHEECPDLEQPAEEKHFLPLEKTEVTDIQSDISVSILKCDTEELTKQREDAIPPLTSSPSFSSSQSALKNAQSGVKVSKTEHQSASFEAADPSFQILKLPFESVLTSGAARASCLSSPAAPYYYNYLSMQTTHERMSVLSPSLDELSSRDEMFSTDLEDVDLFPKRVYTGRRLAEVVGGSPQAAGDVEEVWLPGTKRFMCACCGKSLAKSAGRSKVHNSKMYRDEAADSEEESRYGRGCEQPVRVVVRKHSAPRKSHSVPPRHAKPWYKRGQYKDPSDLGDQEEGRDLCKQDPADGDVGEMTSSELQCRTCQDRLCREDLTTLDQDRWGDGDMNPRRRQAIPLQRQEMSTQRKIVYHRQRDEDNDDDDEPPSLHWERDMETSTLHHTYGLGPRGPNPPHGAQLAQGPQQPGQGPSAAPRPEEEQQQQQQQQQHHHKPFFYIQPSQPCLPMQSLQWPVPVPMPMPVSYNPYYGYPGLGFGMPMMPHYQPNPYMEPPGFVVPHTHLHLMDYRRMLNPQYYQTMAYHARRFRYQHNALAKEMTSSEVQTEPLSGLQRTSTPGSSNVEASSDLQVRSCNSDAPSVPISQPLSPALAVPKGDYSLELKDMVPPSATRTPPNGSFMIQTEEVRIECCTTPVGLQVLHSHETAEVSHGFSQDVVQCSSIVQGVLQDDGLCLPADQSEQSLQACPDILLVGTPNSGEKISELEESRKQVDPVTPVNSKLGSQVSTHGEVEGTGSEKDLSMTSKKFQFKVVHLPFNPKYLEELQKMESTVWSVDETLIPSPELLIQNGLTESYDETLAAVAEVPSADALMLREEAPTEEVVPMIEMSPLAEDELEDVVPTMEGPGNEMVSEADMCLMMDVPVDEEAPEAEGPLSPNLLVLDNSPLKADRNQHRRETHIQDHQDTSFESLPAYLPSTSWLADFDNVYYCRKMPLTPKKQSKHLSGCGLDVPTRRRKLEYKEQPTVRKPKERYKPKGKVDRRSLSDHECCLSRNFNENAFTPYASKRERLCGRCLAKRQICTSASTGLNGPMLKRKAAPFQQWNDSLLPTCEACKSHSNKRPMRKGSSPVCGPHHGHDTEGESSENSSCHAGLKWRLAEDPRRLNDLKRPLASKQNLEKCPEATHPKLRVNNCVCNEPQQRPVAWERLHHCPHGNAIREMDENFTVPVSPQDKWRNMDQIYLTQRWQTEKSWKAVMPNPDGSKNEARSQHLNKHKTSQPQSQGTRRKDTRC
ncbi:hypothetical protein PAMP_010946 [Pampus punctatissimus]